MTRCSNAEIFLLFLCEKDTYPRTTLRNGSLPTSTVSHRKRVLSPHLPENTFIQKTMACTGVRFAVRNCFHQGTSLIPKPVGRAMTARFLKAPLGSAQIPLRVCKEPKSFAKIAAPILDMCLPTDLAKRPEKDSASIPASLI